MRVKANNYPAARRIASSLHKEGYKNVVIRGGRGKDLGKQIITAAKAKRRTGKK